MGSLSPMTYIWHISRVDKTPPFHGGSMGSIPLCVTKKKRVQFGAVVLCFASFVFSVFSVFVQCACCSLPVHLLSTRRAVKVRSRASIYMQY